MRSFLCPVPVTLLFVLAFLAGCASGQNDVWKVGDREAMGLQGSVESPPSGEGVGVFSEEVMDVESRSTLLSDNDEWSGDVHLKQGNLEMARRHYARSLALRPGDTRVRYKWGLTLLAGGSTEDAAAAFRTVLKQDPGFAPAHVGLGQIYFQAGDYDRAEASFRKAIGLDPGLWKCRNYLGILYDYQGKHSMAVIEYLGALQENPDNLSVQNNLGLSYYMAGRYAEAIRTFERCLQTEPGQEHVQHNLELARARFVSRAKPREAVLTAVSGPEAEDTPDETLVTDVNPANDAVPVERSVATHPTIGGSTDEDLRRWRSNLQDPEAFVRDSVVDITFAR